MTIFDEDSDAGTILIAIALCAIVVGIAGYVYSSGEQAVQTAFNGPVIDKPVPDLVPLQPR